MKIRTILYTRILFGAIGTAALAAFLIIAWLNESRDKAIATVGSLASAAAGNLNSHIADTETILGLIAHRPPVRALDPVSCDEGMQLIRDSDPAHASLSIANALGQVVCSIGGQVSPDGISFFDREWFQRVIAENRFVASKPYVGRLTGLLVTVFAYPIRDDRGGVIGSVQLSHTLSQIQPIIKVSDLPPDIRLTVINRDGIVISSHPGTDLIGRYVGDLPIYHESLVGVVGPGIAVQSDGTELVFGYSATPRSDWIAVVSQPLDTALAQVRAQSLWAIGIACAFVVVMVLTTSFSVRRFTRQTDQTMEMVSRIADGDSSVRMIEPALEEFAMIARQTNRMLDIREEANNRILKLNRMYAALSESNHVITKCNERQDMIDNICRIVAERCQFSLAWIGFADPGTGDVLPVAGFGPAREFTEEFRASIDPSNPNGNGLIGHAIRENKLQVVSDVATDERSARWTQVRIYGFQSVGVIPLTQDGKPVGVICLYSPEAHYFDDPELVKLIGEIANDLSFGLAMLRRDEARKDIEERFRQITETIREVFWLTDVTKNEILYISPAYRDIWGREPSTLYTSPSDWIDAIHPDDRARVLDSAKTKQVSGDYDEVYRIVRPDGGIRWIHDRAYPIRNDAGEVYRVAGTADDITERKQMQEAIRSSESLLATTQELAGLGSWERDFKSDRGYWSSTMFRLLNRDPALGIPALDGFMEHVDPADRQKVRDCQLDAIANEREMTTEFHTNPAFGPVRQLRTTIAPVRDADGKVLFFRGGLLDITKIKDTEARLFQAQKMEALGNLAGGIAHDFNNMLLPILNLTELTREELPPDHPAPENLTMVVEAATRASHLVKQILAFGRRSERKLQNVDIALCLDGAVSLLHNALPSTITLVDQIDPATGTCEADPAELHSIILNMGTNAAHAMQGIGKLSLTVSRTCLTSDQLESRPKLSADHCFAKIVISDTGHGMDAETISKIFNPFFTTKPVGEGTGLGLAMVHGIVESLGGFIEVSSVVGSGTTFTLYLPLLAASASSLGAAPSIPGVAA